MTHETFRAIAVLAMADNWLWPDRDITQTARAWGLSDYLWNYDTDPTPEETLWNTLTKSQPPPTHHRHGPHSLVKAWVKGPPRDNVIDMTRYNPEEDEYVRRLIEETNDQRQPPSLPTQN